MTQPLSDLEPRPVCSCGHSIWRIAAGWGPLLARLRALEAVAAEAERYLDQDADDPTRLLDALSVLRNAAITQVESDN